MKSKIYWIIIITFTLASCSDFLDRDPLDRISSNSFWKTEDDFDQALTACYGKMQTNFFSFSLPCWDNITDNGYGQHGSEGYGVTTEIVTGNITPVSTGFISGVYKEAYSAITRINIYLQNLETFTGMDPAKKERCGAEARMLRAFFYSYLYRCYGDVPLVDKPLDLADQYQPKKPAAEILDFIMADIDDAIAKLNDETYSESKGRWTVNAAKAYKARMLLYDAYDSSGNAIGSRMTAVKGLLSGISGYTLAPEFSDNFHDLKQEANPEIIMSIKFLAPNNKTGVDMWYADWIVVSPLANLISEYEMKDGSPGTPVPYTGKGAIDPAVFTNNSLKDRDPRAAQTVFMGKYVVAENTYTPSNTCPLGTGLYKFLSPNLTPPYGYNTYSQQDWVILRYADVLLMLAEAENEINGPTTIVYNAINSIRTRTKLPDLPAGLDKDQMRDRIRHERRVELAFEGQRYFDLKRWKIAKQVLNNVQDGLVDYKFEDKHYLWPLPQSEIDKAGGILVQNPDYQ